jgi:hypothetical protein
MALCYQIPHNADSALVLTNTPATPIHTHTHTGTHIHMHLSFFLNSIVELRLGLNPVSFL